MFKNSMQDQNECKNECKNQHEKGFAALNLWKSLFGRLTRF